MTEPEPKPEVSAYRGFYVIEAPMSESAVARRINEAVHDGTAFEDDVRVLAREQLRILYSLRCYLIFIVVMILLSLIAGMIIGLIAIYQIEHPPATTSYHF